MRLKVRRYFVKSKAERVRKKMQKNVEFEFSAGGIVKRDSGVLLIKTKDLKGNEVWTFPKGKVEKGEKSKETALREVFEETGYVCEIKDNLDEVKYFFKRKGKLVIKKVIWFLMGPVEQKGEPDLNEIDEILWADYDTSKGLLNYKTDLVLLDKVFNKSESVKHKE
jgi:8-oxo-dGTP diphosphatase